MKQLLSSNWHIMRIVRLLFGIFLIFQAVETHQYVFFAFAAFFLFQALIKDAVPMVVKYQPKTKELRHKQ